MTLAPQHHHEDCDLRNSHAAVETEQRFGVPEGETPTEVHDCNLDCDPTPLAVTYDFDNFPRTFAEYDEARGLDHEDDDLNWSATLTGRVDAGDVSAMIDALSIIVSAAHYTPALHRLDETDEVLRSIGRWIVAQGGQA